MKIFFLIFVIKISYCQNSVQMIAPTFVDPDTHQQYNPNSYNYQDGNNQYRTLLVNQYNSGYGYDQSDRSNSMLGSLAGAAAGAASSSSSSDPNQDKDPNVPQTYPFLGVSYKITNPPYAPVTLVPYVEEDNTTKSVGTTVQSNVVITGRKKLII